MKINIRGDKIEVTESIKNYVKEKLARLDRYFENASKIDAHVIVRARNGEQIIEVTVPTSRYTLRAEEKHSDLYAAIDLVVDVLERQIRKNKTKLNKRRDAADVVFSFIPEEDEEYVETNQVVKRKTVENKPMSEEEAILQMELLDHDFFLYNDVDEGCFAVIYKRKDGNYGIIYSK
jgi:putative sigma-54 modulation protein